MIGLIIALFLVPYVLIYFLKKTIYTTPENFPPGPPSLPVLGAYPIVKYTNFSNLANAFIKLGEKYKTKIVGLYLAHVPAVVVNDPALIKQVLLTEEFDGRLDIILFRLRSYWKKLGIFFTDGYFWHVQRRFSLRYMRDFGFGRKSDTLEGVISQEIREIIDMTVNGPKYPAEKEIVKGDLIYLPHYFAPPFINGICHVVSRSTLPRSEYHRLWTLSKGALLFQRNSDDLGGFLSLQPWIKDFFPKWSGYKPLVEGNQELLNFFKVLVEEAISTFDPSSEDRHFLDTYIRKMKEEQSEKKKTTYSEEQLRLICTDYMFPAASATEAVLTMLVERLLLQPEIQDKIHEEIDRVVGRDRNIMHDDRKNMPYTEACLREIMRYDTLVPLGVPHRSTENVKFAGYDIPKDTLVAVNYVVLHTDKSIWSDPENFRPERFIKDGQLDVASDKSLPFGAGRRLCAGETYARQTMFQVFANFMQTFKVSTADGKPLPGPAPRIPGIITTIPNFWVRVTPRT